MPTTVVLPILALLWIAVLTPIVVRRVRDYRAVDRIDTFHDSLHLLDRSSDAFSTRRPELVLLRPVQGVDDAADLYVDEDSGACFDRVPVRSGIQTGATPGRHRRRAAARRRRNVLLGLVVSTILTSGAAVVTGSALAIGAAGVAGLCFVTYLGALVVLAAQAPTYRRVVRPRTDVADEWPEAATGF
jgi:hypothetical protein